MLKSPRNGRKFGLTMTGVAGFFAVLLLYRQRIGGAAVLGLVALLFALIALTAPKLLEPVEAAWMTFARVLDTPDSGAHQLGEC